MKKLMACVAAVAAVVANAALVEDAAGLSAAVSAAESGDTIKLKADAVIELTATIELPNNKALTISGGWTDESTCVPGKMSTLSGDGSLETLMSVANEADCPVALKHLVFTKAMRHTFQKSGGDGNLTVTDCAFKDNVTTSVYGGIALQLLGTENASLAIDGCTFDNNVTASQETTDPKNDDDYGENGGLAVRISQFKQVTITDSTFTRNGIPFDFQVVRGGYKNGNGLGYWNEVWGSTMFVQDAPVAMSRCTFRANRGATSGQVDTGGGIVHLRGAGDGTTIDHCLFVGNEEVHGHAVTSGPKYGYGALVIGLNAGCTATIDHTTIAYNLSDTVESAAGLTVYTGTAVVRNSIIFGNTMWATAKGGADLTVNAGASADVDATLFTANDIAHVLDAVGNGLTRRGGVVYGDPLFATPLEEALAPVQVGTDGRRYFAFDKLDVVLGFDVHLRSKQGSRRNGSAEWTLDAVNSPALDAGETTADYANEPTPNGNRLNLGRYGNTDEASKSVAVKPEIESVDVAFPDNKSKPLVTVKLAAVDDGDYNADATITFWTTSADRVENVFPGVHPGATLVTAKSAYFTPGANLSVRVKVSAAGFEDVVYETTVKVTGELSPYIGHGGGAHVVHLRADADGAGTGEDWLNAFTDLKAALVALGGEKTELWIAGTVVASAASSTLSPDVPLLIRGGFTGLEDDAAERPSGLRSVLSGGGAYDLVIFNNGADRSVSFERLEFREGAVHAVRKSGGDGDVAFDDCVFADNVVGGHVGGAALQLLGTAKATATIRNCTFVNNVTTSQETDPKNDDNYGKNGGLAVRISQFKQVTITDSTFTRNGIPFDFQVGGGGHHNGNGLGYWNVIYGSTLFVQDAPVAMSGCAFRANRGSTSGSANGGGGIVHLRGAGDGTTIDHCLFVGNEEVHGNQDITKPVDSYGALVIGLNADSVATIDHTTIAYNTSDTAGSAAGLTVFSGKAVVRNSIVFGNSLNASGAGGADLTVFADGQADVDYTLFSANDQSRVRAASAGGLVLRGGVIYGDPLFVTTLDEALAPVVTGPGERRHFDFDKLDTVLGFDVHLRSKKGSRRNGSAEWTLDAVYSPALDAGDPTADYANETEPNGNRLNLGRYGNTDEASRSEIATPELGGVEIAFADGYSRPDITVSMVEDADASYSATVKVCCGTGDVATAGWQYEKSVSGVHAGDVLPFAVTSYFTKDDTLTVRVEISLPGIDPIVREIQRTVKGEYPPWFGKGGPANVLHVLSGAKGKGTGESWTDAYVDLASAFAAVRDGKDEIWVAGTVVASAVPGTLSPDVPLLIRGGFTGLEDDAAERPSGLRSVLSGGGAYDLVIFNNEADRSVSFERLEFREGAVHAVRKSGGDGDVAFDDCVFADNVVGGRVGGAALQLLGTAKATATIRNCTFVNNVTTSQETDPTKDDNYGENGGLAVRISQFKQVTITDSTFTRNGIPFDFQVGGGGWLNGNGLGYWNVVYGSTLFVQDAPVAMSGCAFRANRGSTAGEANGGGGIVHLRGAGDGTTIDHCLFVGNEEVHGHQNITKPVNSYGALVIGLNAGSVATIDHTTIAYNMSDTAGSAAGLTVFSGRAVVRNSILFGNSLNASSAGGADLTVFADGQADVDYTLFSANDQSRVRAVSADGLVLRGGVIYGDPLFVTTLDEALAPVVTGPGERRHFDSAALDTVLGFNVHLRGKYGYTDEKTGELVRFPRMMSPAIDAGDPAGPWRSEPMPNGRRANLGAYGNTPYATRSQLKGLMLLVK